MKHADRIHQSNSHQHNPDDLFAGRNFRQDRDPEQDRHRRHRRRKQHRPANAKYTDRMAIADDANDPLQATLQ